MRQILKSAAEAVGKTVEGVSAVTGYAVIHFTDGSSLAFKASPDFEGQQDVGVENKFSQSSLTTLELGFVTQEEFRDACDQEMKVSAEYHEALERATLARLK